MSSSLSSHERSVIETMIKLNHSIREIARFLNRSPATIAYELKRITTLQCHNSSYACQTEQT